MYVRPPGSPPFPYTTLFRSGTMRRMTVSGEWRCPAARERERRGAPGGNAGKGFVVNFEGRYGAWVNSCPHRSEEHTSEVQSPMYHVSRRLPERRQHNKRQTI